MAIWDAWTAAVERFTAGMAGSGKAARARRTDVARVVHALAITPARPDRVRHAAFRTVPAARVREIHEYLTRPDARAAFRAAVAKYRELLRPLVLATPFPPEAAVHTLLDDRSGFNQSAPFDAEEFLGAADVVYARDVSTGARVLLFGRDLAARAGAGEAVGPYRTATVVLDFGSGELELMLSALDLLKGRHEYVPQS